MRRTTASARDSSPAEWYACGMNWPADHPNAKVLALVADTRAELDRSSASPQATRLRSILDEIERLVGEMRAGKTRDEIQQLVLQVQLLTPHVHSIMDVVRMLERNAGRP